MVRGEPAGYQRPWQIAPHIPAIDKLNGNDGISAVRTVRHEHRPLSGVLQIPLGRSECAPANS